MNDLYEQAKNVLSNSYSKYSGFKVAAAIRLHDGTIITGVNVENASFGLTNCAERTALYTAYTKGYRKEDIKEMVITTEKDHLVSPCGACRQVMSELMTPDVPIHLVTNNGSVTTVSNKELLPLAFDESDL
ncbi:cytidine deaminase [Candidatus Xianfuyuplasma coldseepsis]|uniref:Cytidine deaminase n=1 Tax=Candidatus Xianfuyuplasma coldseepsis TaxID=2782163 RepID=A0A7L7KSW8_9MOLU|nr:cytidine deaminase [Xianfuyuplasma coldseepsis]QMS85910.1 cytidine deaminase [Xianfuyuplasma coldseepsis]